MAPCLEYGANQDSLHPTSWFQSSEQVKETHVKLCILPYSRSTLHETWMTALLALQRPQGIAQFYPRACHPQPRNPHRNRVPLSMQKNFYSLVVCGQLTDTPLVGSVFGTLCPKQTHSALRLFWMKKKTSHQKRPLTESPIALTGSQTFCHCLLLPALTFLRHCCGSIPPGCAFCCDSFFPSWCLELTGSSFLACLTWMIRVSSSEEAMFITPIRWVLTPGSKNSSSIQEGERETAGLWNLTEDLRTVPEELYPVLTLAF